MQFALHYSWSTEARARRALANISALLRPGGTLIGTMPDANVIVKKLREGFVSHLIRFSFSGFIWNVVEPENSESCNVLSYVAFSFFSLALFSSFLGLL